MSEQQENEAIRALIQSGARRQPNYNSAQKRFLLGLHFEKGVTLSQISKDYGVNKVTLWRWIRKFADGTKTVSEQPAPQSVISTNPSLMKNKAEIKNETPEDELARLREENKRLSEALQMSEWMNHAKDVMIDEAEKAFNIPIRKKSGAKQ